MTSSTSTRTVDTTSTALKCAACGHVLAGHDPIGERFCRATTAGGLDRSCICPASAT